MKEEKSINSIDFVVKNYRKGVFNAKKALKILHKDHYSWWSPLKIAAACVVFAILGVSAGIIIHNHYFVADSSVIHDDIEAYGDIHEVRVIDFEQATLPQVVERINEVYGVTVTDLPDDASSYTLSLHYEGSALDLIGVINEILDTNMSIQQ